MGSLLAEWSAATMKEIGLLFFFSFFVIVVLRLVFTRRDRYDDVARIPLDDDPRGEAGPVGAAGANENRG